MIFDFRNPMYWENFAICLDQSRLGWMWRPRKRVGSLEGGTGRSFKKSGSLESGKVEKSTVFGPLSSVV
jgi:hypothetical protein